VSDFHLTQKNEQFSATCIPLQGRIQDYKLGGGGALKKIAPSGGGSKIFGVFRVKNHDFTPKNHIFSNFRGGARRVRPTPGLLEQVTVY
jgi:hypothetical protein